MTLTNIAELECLICQSSKPPSAQKALLLSMPIGKSCAGHPESPTVI